MYRQLFAYECRLLITFANSLDPDQAWQKVGTDMDPIYRTLMVTAENFLKKWFWKKWTADKTACKITKYAKRECYILETRVFIWTSDI